MQLYNAIIYIYSYLYIYIRYASINGNPYAWKIQINVLAPDFKPKARGVGAVTTWFQGLQHLPRGEMHGPHGAREMTDTLW
jgi:hypothetical protein